MLRFGDELFKAKRLYQTYGVGLVGRIESATAVSLSGTLPVQPRTAGTFTLGTTTNGLIVPGVTFYAPTSVSAATVYENGVYIVLVSSGMSAGNIVLGNTNFLNIDADL